MTFPVPMVVRDGMDEAVQAVWESMEIALACRTKVIEGMKIVRLSGEINLNEK